MRSERFVATSEFKQFFGSSVKSWRNRLGISQEELAGRAGLHRTYVSDIERGTRNVSLENIDKLARALKVSVATLFDQPEKPSILRSSEQLVDILLVEDNPDDVQLTLHALEKARITNPIEVVRDGAEALHFLFCTGSFSHRQFAARPQVILLDLGLPKISGIEVLRSIKSDSRTRSIPVVVLTASRHDRDVRLSKQLGVESYIVKPVGFQNLSAVTPGLSLNWALMKRTDPEWT